jgi:hypothetical protein
LPEIFESRGSAIHATAGNVFTRSPSYVLTR